MSTNKKLGKNGEIRTTDNMFGNRLSGLSDRVSSSALD